MRKYIITLIKWGLLVFFAIIVSVLLYHELWFLEYYHLPPVSFVRIEPERTRLINGIESYQSIDEFKGSLSRSLFQWEEGKDNQPASTGRPPFNTHTITVKNYSHLGFSGELIIRFFNNRLAGSVFYPQEVEKYILALEKDGMEFGNSRETTLLPHTRVLVTTDYKGRKYVDWSDTRLDKEIELWIRRYS